jgi:hypothetical protein
MPSTGFDLPNLREPGKVHRFSAENQPAGRGRPKGSGDKVTRDLKRGLIDGAISHGYDGEGLDGLPGYCRYLARFHPKAFASLLGKMLPYQIDGNVGQFIGTVNILGVPSDNFLSAEDIERLRAPALLEHEPASEQTEID